MDVEGHRTSSSKRQDEFQEHFGERRLGKAALEAMARQGGAVDVSQLPDVRDMSPKMITDNVLAINSLCTIPRLKFLMEGLVRHLHDYAREVSLTTEEWMMAIEFLTKTGQTCTPLRQEFILLSDVFGLSTLVDAMNNPKPANSNATESTVLGPFFTDDSADLSHGDSIASEGKGEYMYVCGNVKGSDGEPIAGCIIETWETDHEGFYDTQYEGRKTADCRGRIKTDASGFYCFKGVRPVAYPIPNDGPVGGFLRAMNRHVFRPAHLHMVLLAEGYEPLTTSLYPEGHDDYLHSDAVFGVKSSLVCKLEAVRDESEARRLGFRRGPFWRLEWDFVLQTREQAKEARKEALAAYYRFASWI